MPYVLIDNTRLLFPFILQPTEFYLLTVVIPVLLVDVLYKGFQICKTFVLHRTSFLCSLDIAGLTCIVSSICSLSDYLSKEYES